MEKEKKDLFGWWMWILLLIIFTGIILGVTGSFGKIFHTVVERKVFENSYQKHESDKTAITTYQAQIVQLRGKLNNPNLTNGNRIEIQSQIDLLLILLQTKGD